jgi:D-alanyl-D-alanine carboxypeptidase
MNAPPRPAAVLVLVLALAGCGPSASAAPSATPAGLGAKAAPSHAPRPADLGPETVAAGPALSRPDQPASTARFRPALVADHCIDRDLPAPPATDMALTVLDRSYALPPTYAPSDLVAASAAGLTGTSGTKLVRAVVIDDLAAMHAAWQAAGLAVSIGSGYRSYETQATTFDAWLARLGYEAALVRSARPGHSEHQLGTAIDVSSPGWDGRFGDWAAETAEGRWMADHAWEYGFVMSYPAGSQAVTCFSYEPWHYRWIGREAAAAQRASGLTLRQYLATVAGG